MNIKKSAVFLFSSILALFFTFTTAWAGGPGFHRGHGHGLYNGHHRDRYVHARPGKFHGAVVEKRQGLQAGRIHHGVRTGEITRPEARRLKTEQWRIHRSYRRATADGHFNRYERRHLDRMQDRVSRHIFWSKHNDFKQHRHFSPRHHDFRRYRQVPPRHFGHWKYPHWGWSRFSAGLWDSGWRFAFSVGGR